MVFKEIYDELYTKDLRKLGRKKADEKWKGDHRIADFEQATASDKIAVELVRGWMRGNKGGCPGYCFCSDEVLASVLGNGLNLRSTNRDLILEIRRRLGLRKAKVHFVLKTGKVLFLR